MPTTTTTTVNGFGRLFARAFHATPITRTKHSKKRLEEMLKDLPPYPYPINRTFKQSWFGLYGGKHIQFGNNVPESRNKTRRDWQPNVREKKLYSECLSRFVSVRLVASVLRKSCLPNRGTLAANPGDWSELQGLSTKWVVSTITSPVRSRRESKSWAPWVGNCGGKS